MRLVPVSGLMTLSGIALLFAATVVLLSCSSNPVNKEPGEVSAPFDGKKFDNLEPFPDKSFLRVLKWRFSRTSTAAKWPEKIEQRYFKPVIERSVKLQAAVLGHSTALIQVDNVNILTDPNFSQRASFVSWAGPERVTQPGIPFEDLPPIDVVVISHNHYDHLDIPSLKKIAEVHDPKILVGLGNGRLLERHGITNYVEMDWWDEVPLNGIGFHMVPVQHWSARGLFDKRKTLWGGFVIEASKQIFFAGDTGYGSVFKEIGRRYGSMDLSVLPIGAYAPREFMKNAHINPDESVKVLLDVQSKNAIAVHFRTFSGLTDEAIDQPEIDLQAALKKHGVSASSFVVPEFGRTYSF